MFTELVRLGKDAELKTTQSGDLLSIYAVYDVGFGDKKKGQWIGLTLFGKRASQVAGMMVKGVQIMATMDEVQVEEYGGKSYLKAKLVEFKFAGPKPQQEQEAPRQQRQATRPAPQPAADGFDDEDLLPF